MSEPLTVTLPPEALEVIAQRAAELVTDQLAQNGGGFLDVQQAAEFLACPPSRLYALVSAKRIPFHKDGSRLLFDRDELRVYIRYGGARRP